MLTLGELVGGGKTFNFGPESHSFCLLAFFAPAIPNFGGMETFSLFYWDTGRFFDDGRLLFAIFRIFRRDFSLVRFVLACSDGREGILGVYVARLFLRFHDIKRCLNAGANYTNLERGAREGDDFFLARIGGRGLDSVGNLLQVRFRLIRRVRGAINAGQGACTQCPYRARCADRIVMAASANSATGLRVGHLRLGGDAYVMVRSAYRYRIGLCFIFRSRHLGNVRGGLALFRSLRAYFTVKGCDLRYDRLLDVNSARGGSELRFNGDLFASALLNRLFVSVIRAGFVRFVSYCYGVCCFVHLSCSFNGANRGLAVVSFGTGTSARANGRHVGGLRRFGFIRR